jgi:hypothetical protein
MVNNKDAYRAREHLADACDSLHIAAFQPFEKNRHIDNAVESIREALKLMGYEVTQMLTPQQAHDQALERRRAEDRV